MFVFTVTLVLLWSYENNKINNSKSVIKIVVVFMLSFSAIMLPDP
jgi:uncharacterized membrane protein